MSAISNFLTFLRSAIYAIDVRDGIADAIEQCYNDVNNPTLKTEALEAALQTKIDEGEMAALTIGDHTITAAKLAQGVIDNTLATSGAAADAKKTGDEISEIKADLGNLTDLETETKTDLVSAINEAAQSGLSNDVKDALLACISHVMMYGDAGVDYYSDLEEALYPTGKYVALQMSDVVSSRGITNFSVDALGNISYSEVAKFSVIEFSQDIKQIEFYQDTNSPAGGRAWFIFRKVNNNTFYGTDGNNVFVFTWDSATGKYTATQDNTLATVTTSNVGTFKVPQRKTLSIKNGIATMKNENGGSVSLTNANMIGIWEQSNMCAYKAVRVKR